MATSHPKPKNVPEWDNGQCNPLSNFEALLYSFIVDKFFCFEDKNYSPQAKPAEN